MRFNLIYEEDNHLILLLHSLQVAQMEKRNLEMHLSKLSSQGLNKNILKELVEANNQVKL